MYFYVRKQRSIDIDIDIDFDFISSIWLHSNMGFVSKIMYISMLKLKSNIN